MILQNLCEYYDRLDAAGDIASLGFCPQNISFCLVLEADGVLADVLDLRSSETLGKGKPKLRAVKMTVPFLRERSSNVSPNFLWDNTGYVLGRKQGKSAKKNTKAFEEFRNLHRKILDRTENDRLKAVVRFLESWNPESDAYERLSYSEELDGANLVFKLRGENLYIHQDPELLKMWPSYYREELDTSYAFDLISGQEKDVVERHEPSVKPIRGGQTSGNKLVSFNDDAFTSYGKTQSYNAPVALEAAFKYTTALNKLLERDSNRKVLLGETTCVYWADQPTESEDLFGFGLEGLPSEDENRAREIGALLRRIAQGVAQPPDPDVGFHVLGLSPNASRLSIRFWITGKAGELVERVAKHQQRLDIVHSPKDHDVLPLWLLLAQTARETKDIPPQLEGDVLRAILMDDRYPDSFFAAILRRIRADREIRHPRAAIIKAILICNYQKEIPIMLDPERTEASYQLGRLFAALERTQEDAMPGLNATVKDRYFGAASATPSSVFPRLIRMSQHHVHKLEGGKKVVAEKRMQEIMGRFNEFPAHLSLADQGLFALGYYHQRQDFFTKKKKKDNGEE